MWQCVLPQKQLRNGGCLGSCVRICILPYSVGCVMPSLGIGKDKMIISCTFLKYALYLIVWKPKLLFLFLMLDNITIRFYIPPYHLPFYEKETYFCIASCRFSRCCGNACLPRSCGGAGSHFGNGSGYKRGTGTGFRECGSCNFGSGNRAQNGRGCVHGC